MRPLDVHRHATNWKEQRSPRTAGRAAAREAPLIAVTVMEPAHADVVFRERSRNPGAPFAQDKPKNIAGGALEPGLRPHERPPRNAPRTSTRNDRPWIFQRATDDHAPQHLLGVIRRSLTAIAQNRACRGQRRTSIIIYASPPTSTHSG